MVAVVKVNGSNGPFAPWGSGTRPPLFLAQKTFFRCSETQPFSLRFFRLFPLSQVLNLSFLLHHLPSAVPQLFSLFDFSRLPSSFFLVRSSLSNTQPPLSLPPENPP